MDEQQPVDWQHWLSRWDSQQAGYAPKREERFEVMFAVLQALLPENFVALDLACGPGAISQRLLSRFPHARSVAVDFDPVMLALGQGALGDAGGRLEWVDADLSERSWVESVGPAPFDAALSTTALHWLAPQQLVALYHDLGRQLRPGGVFLNGDNMDFGPHLPAIREMARKSREQEWSDESFARRGVETAEQWWAALEQAPSMAPLIAERSRRLSSKQRPASAAGLDLQIAALRDAGFREAATVWQNGTDRVLLAVR